MPAILNKISQRLRNSSFFKNVLIVMSGNALAQIIGYALIPLISRLFTPADFGLFGNFSSVVSIITAGITLEYYQAMMLPKEKSDALNLFFVSCLTCIIITLLCLVACMLAPTFFLNLIKAQHAYILVLLILAILITGLNASLYAWCVRVKAFNNTSVSQIIRSASSNGSQIGFGYQKSGGVGLIIASVLADFLASLNLLRIFILDFKILRHHVQWSRMKQLAKEYRDFPLYSAPGSYINAISTGLPVLLLTHFFGISVAGAYALGLRILSAPVGLIIGALRQVLFQKASEAEHQNQSLLSLYIKTTVGLFAVAILPALVLLIFAPQLFTLILGTQWHMAGVFARSLTVWLLFMFCSLPSVLFARILRLQRRLFIFDIVLLAIRSLILILGGFFMSATYTIMFFAIAGAIMNGIFIAIVYHELVKKEGATEWESIQRFIRGA